MDLINNSGLSDKEKSSENKEAKSPKRTIFELIEESGGATYQKPEVENPDYPKNFLEKLHIRNHELNSLETIHELYKEEIPERESDTDLLSEEDEYLFNEVKNAVTEKDIIDLRANLQAISKTVSNCQLSTEDIEKYLDGVIDPQEYELIQKELKSDVSLSNEIALYTQINEAIGEKDIMQLRSNLQAIMLSESSHSRTFEEIEDYVTGGMDDSMKNSFEDEAISYHHLASDIKLFTEINEAISEKDIMNLRSILTTMDKDTNKPEIRGVRNRLSLKLAKKYWFIAAASVAVLMGINLFFYVSCEPGSKIYNDYYRPAECDLGTMRSAANNTEEQMISQAFTMLSIKEYDKALELFKSLMSKDNLNPAANFYTGTIYQLRGDYTDAVQSYKKVISESDNLFIEQADWYLGFCYLKMNQHNKAIDQFRKISRGKGYYAQKSNSILKKLE